MIVAHVRKQIRDDVVTTLTGLTTTGSSVYKTRVYPIEEGKLPALLIYTDSEVINTATISPPRTQLRVLTLRVEAYVKAVSNYDDTLDTIAEQVEEALSADLTRGSLAKDTRIVGFEAEYSGDGDQPVATGIINVEIDYATLENAVDTAV